MKKIQMVEIREKPVVYRSAIASGEIFLKEKTIKAIKNNKIKKGDVLTTAQIAAINAVKNTPSIIPLCHPIQITGVDLDFEIKKDKIKVNVKVTSEGKTGVEMEALTGVSAALLTIWDMVKSVEKDEKGQYPTTKISNIKVVEKRKEKK